jgi:DNA replication and repair protein RecF
MKIQKLKLNNFRNYEKLDLEFSPYVNILYGQNGTGKTNIVESIYYLALTKSFRVNNDRLLIKKGAVAASVSGDVLTNVSTNYKISIKESGKKTEIDGTKQEKVSDYVSNINVILFQPDDTRIITDAPSYRRKLLNIEISQLHKEYLLLLSGYDKILKHRNNYLKELYINGNASKEYLDILTKKLIDFGLRINEYRSKFIEGINEYIGEIYKNIFTHGELKVKYSSNFNKKSEKELLDIYKKAYSREMALGKTMIGIHHDDLEFYLDGNKVKEWGSVGQVKNTIISFKLAELIIVEKTKKEFPILILDDLFSELDKEKVTNILKMLNNYVQTFITTTEIETVDLSLFKECKIFKIDYGTVEEE